MNDSPLQPPSIPATAAPRRSPWRALVVWLVAVSAVTAVVAVPYALINALRLEPGTGELRDAVTGAFAGDAAGWSRHVEVRVGSCAFGLARLVARCVDMPEEARHALRAARSASVGVYQWRGADLDAMRRTMADAASSIRADGRSWIRLVNVRTGDESVVVLTPEHADPEADVLELCVVVLAKGELVVVSVEIDPRPLGDLIAPHLRAARCEIEDAV